GGDHLAVEVAAQRREALLGADELRPLRLPGVDNVEAHRRAAAGGARPTAVVALLPGARETVSDVCHLVVAEPLLDADLRCTGARDFLDAPARGRLGAGGAHLVFSGADLPGMI